MLDFLKQILIFFLIFIHKLIVYFMILGFLLPYKYLYIFLLTWPIVYIHWQLNNDMCCLTQLEYYLKNKPNPPTSKEDHDYPFAKKFLSIFNINLPNDKIHQFILINLTILWFIGLLRLIYYYHYIKK